MQTSPLSASPRTDHGKGPSRRLRRTGTIPAVLYSAGKDAISLSVDPRALGKAIATPFKMNTIIALTVDGAASGRNVMLKDVQRHPVKRDLIHADFVEIDVSKPIRVHIPVVLTGKNKNLGAGGVVEQVTRSITVMAMPASIPEKVELDVSELKMGQSVHSADLKLPQGLTMVGAGKETIATVVAVAEEKEETPTTAAAEGAAPAEGAAAAPGAAPAAGAAAKPGDAKAADAKAAPAKEEAKKK